MILPNPSRPYRAWRLPRTAGLPLLALALAGLLSACGKDAPKPGAAAPEVTVLTLRSQPLALQQELPGRSVASQESDVRPQVDGVLVKRLFEQGQWVKAGSHCSRSSPRCTRRR